MNWILIAVIAILGVLGFIGFKKGLIKMVFSLVSTIVALLVAMLFSPVVAGVMKNNEAIVGFFDEKISAIVDFTSDEVQEGTPEETEEKQQSWIESLPLPETFKESILENNTTENYMSMQVDKFEEYVCRQISNVIINAIAFVVTLILAIIVLAILCKTLDLLAKLPLLKQINAVAGLGAGVVEGLLLVWILFVILTMFAGSEFGRSSLEMIAENPLLDFLYKNNMVSKFIARG